MSDDESAGHLFTPPKGCGKCCAGVHCVNKNKNYYNQPVCDNCRGIAHEKGCFVFTMGPDGHSFECLHCKNLRETREKRAKAKELREHKEVVKKLRAAHKQMLQSQKLKNPWDVPRLKKMGVVPSPLRMNRHPAQKK